MSAQKKQDQINLLPEANFESTTTGRVLSWILSTFRIIVIVTEIIVMVAFLSRFWLDAQNTDLSDEIENRTNVLVKSQNFETEFKNTQKKLAVFSELTKRQGLYADALSTIVSFLPPDLYLTLTNFEENSVQIEGASPNEVSIQQLIVNLMSSDEFSEVSLMELTTNPKDPYLMNFKLTANYSKKEDI